jgi:hypothetical protein
MAALHFLRARPNLRLGTWLNHPYIENVVQSAFTSEGRLVLDFHTKKNAARRAVLRRYSCFDHDGFERVIQTLALWSYTLRPVSCEGDQQTRN